MINPITVVQYHTEGCTATAVTYLIVIFTCSRIVHRWTGRTTVSGNLWCNLSTWTAILSYPRRPSTTGAAASSFSSLMRPSRGGSTTTNKNDGRSDGDGRGRPTFLYSLPANYMRTTETETSTKVRGERELQRRVQI